ncbi:MAG: hypothetical protein KAJ19_28940 [Gammaproteobacteria bacterium]|nr:hypothetical protein [Gammaproteobacteria bacterium]
MKIISSVSDRNWKRLCKYKGGTPVRFRKSFNSDDRRDDVFIVNAVCDTYRPSSRCHEGKICVTKLEDGRVSYVDSDREVSVVDCYVKLEEC